MTDAPPLLALQTALTTEIAALQAARDHAEAGAAVIASLHVAGLDRWTHHQAALLLALRAASTDRAAQMQRCLPEGSGTPNREGLADRIAFLAILAFAPPQVADALRQGRDRLRGLKDELTLLLARNEILLRDVLTFTQTLPSALPTPDAPVGYTAAGRKPDELPREGDLLRVSV